MIAIAGQPRGHPRWDRQHSLNHLPQAHYERREAWLRANPTPLETYIAGAHSAQPNKEKAAAPRNVRRL